MLQNVLLAHAGEAESLGRLTDPAMVVPLPFYNVRTVVHDPRQTARSFQNSEMIPAVVS
ncbi:hypothetical protein REMIM1_PE00366 (plasmid) [Rhizobium etli bv. mimosae str. Mim1]|nr:hypothetical protein REMIM1_PE00366 [Rhizobium etli bv. mimosae str. Mim1]